jgi:hypothetical protein
MVVSSTRLTCAIEEPTIPGIISRPMRRTPSCAGRQRGQPRSPRRATVGSCISNCSTPATNTPTASTMPGLRLCSAMPTANTIITRFIATCVKAGRAKRR